MPIEIGVTDITGLYLGNTQISTAYVGSSLVYTSGATTTTATPTTTSTTTTTLAPTTTTTTTLAPTTTTTTTTIAPTTTTTTTTSAPTTTTTTAAPALLTIARNNGSSTFTGIGTSGSPYVRATGLYIDDVDGLSRYSWTAGGTGTVYLSFGYSDDSDSSQSRSIRKNGIAVSTAQSPNGDAVNVTVSVVSGDIITITATGDQSNQYFANISIYAI